jgi:DNA-binding GntR family transcriptional regulator
MCAQKPRYRELYEKLRKHILEGVYKPGDLLPSENELCAVNQVTRPTVRQALNLLANEGYIKKRQGLGSVVQSPPKGVDILSLSGTTLAIGSDKLKTEAIVKPNVRPWPLNFNFELTEVERESGCIHFERLRFVNDIPIFYDISYLPNINLPRFTSRSLNNVSLFNILREHYQIQVKGGEQNILAIKADERIQEHFGVSKNHPILRLDRKMETNREGFSFYSQIYCNTEDYRLTGRF